MQSVAVYCGSSPGKGDVYLEVAKSLGILLAARGIRLVYGGGGVGLMGAVADSVMEAQGEVIGVIPGFLEELELGHTGITEMIRVGTMHERKIKMIELADAFIALPGGLGTMEELFEVLAWSQLRIHSKPCGLLNVNGYYDGLIACLDTMTHEELLGHTDRGRLIEANSAEDLMDAMEAWTPPEEGKFGLQPQVL